MINSFSKKPLTFMSGLFDLRLSEFGEGELGRLAKAYKKFARACARAVRQLKGRLNVR